MTFDRVDSIQPLQIVCIIQISKQLLQIFKFDRHLEDCPFHTASESVFVG